MKTYPMRTALIKVETTDANLPSRMYPSTSATPRKSQRIAAVGRKIQVRDAIASDSVKDPCLFGDVPRTLSPNDLVCSPEGVLKGQ